MTNILMVCLGNINRSPTAEAIMRKKAEIHGLDCTVDGCGTGGGSSNWYRKGGFSYHEGESPAPKMKEIARKRGFNLVGHSRPLSPADIQKFDYIFGMDPANCKDILEASEHWGLRDIASSKVFLITNFCSDKNMHGKGIPDPYYESGAGDRVVDILEDACNQIINKLKVKGLLD